jgi:hypothetical protein
VLAKNSRLTKHEHALASTAIAPVFQHSEVLTVGPIGNCFTLCCGVGGSVCAVKSNLSRVLGVADERHELRGCAFRAIARRATDTSKCGF